MIFLILLISCKKEVKFNQSIKLVPPSSEYHYNSLDSTTDCYFNINDYSISNQDNVLMRNGKIFTNRGTFEVEEVWDSISEYADRYHLVSNGKKVGMIQCENADDKSSACNIMIDTSFFKTKESDFTIYRTDGKNLAKLPLPKYKKDFLRKHGILK